MQRGSRRTDQGFTIVEAIVALAIVTTGVLALASLAAQVTDGVVRARRHTAATVLADQAIAARLRLPFAATAADCVQLDVSGCMEGLDGDGLVTNGSPAFVRRWRAVSLSGATPAPWGLTVCVVPVHERRGSSPTTVGACVARVVWEAEP